VDSEHALEHDPQLVALTRVRLELDDHLDGHQHVLPVARA
jgi:hypothetical protein